MQESNQTSPVWEQCLIPLTFKLPCVISVIHKCIRLYKFIFTCPFVRAGALVQVDIVHTTPPLVAGSLGVGVVLTRHFGGYIIGYIRG